jgi:hypothetical protein
MDPTKSDATQSEQSAHAAAAAATAEEGGRDGVGGKALSDIPVTAQVLRGEDIAPLIDRVGAPLLAEFERMMADLTEARTYLESEGERVRREADRYLQLAQTTTESIRMISEAIGEWRNAGHPLQ